MCKQLFLITKFRELPENTIAVKILKSKNKKFFAIKQIANFETLIKMPIHTASLSLDSQTRLDLLTHQSEDVWCISKNYVRDPILDKNHKFHLSEEKFKFIKYKLVVLKYLIKDNKMSMEALMKLKREVRTEINFRLV